MRFGADRRRRQAMFCSLKVVIFMGGFILFPLVAYLYLKKPAVERSNAGEEKHFD